MAVFVFDPDKNQISVIIEKGDSIRTKNGNVTEISPATHYATGHMFAHGTLDVVMIRGERN